MASKNFILDTNVLLEHDDVINVIRNGVDGGDINQIHIPVTVIEELDNLKRKSNRLRPQVMKVIHSLIENKQHIKIIGETEYKTPDNMILREIEASKDIDNPILVTNDLLLQFKSTVHGLEIQDYHSSKPFESDSEKLTGFVEPAYLNSGNINTDALLDVENDNFFFFDEGKLNFVHKGDDPKLIDYDNMVWKVKPRNIYQNAVMELLLNPDLDLVSIQSTAGRGKTFLALATALQLVLQDKRYSKIYVLKNNIEIGEKLGSLPGSIEDKMDPFFKPVKDLLIKLHRSRPANKLFSSTGADEEFKFSSKKIEFLPINYARGMNLENCVVIGEEFQNFSRNDARTILTRMGDNVKCILTGDTKQIDNTHLNESNNGLNWVVKLCNGKRNYAHIVLKGKKGRGPICDLIVNSGL